MSRCTTNMLMGPAPANLRRWGHESDCGLTTGVEEPDTRNRRGGQSRTDCLLGYEPAGIPFPHTALS